MTTLTDSADPTPDHHPEDPIPVEPYRVIVAALIERRQALGLRQLEVDDKIGCAGGLVGKWECGDRRASLVSLVMWAEALGCRIALATTSVPIPLDKTGEALESLVKARCGLRLVEMETRRERRGAVPDHTRQARNDHFDSGQGAPPLNVVE
jgi:transcriptional regulator with XRE-family HTH domain